MRIFSPVCCVWKFSIYKYDQLSTREPRQLVIAKSERVYIILEMDGAVTIFHNYVDEIAARDRFNYLKNIAINVSFIFSSNI